MDLLGFLAGRKGQSSGGKQRQKVGGQNWFKIVNGV
jgi:hypothetical protein